MSGASLCRSFARPGAVAGVCLLLAGLAAAQTVEPEFGMRSWDAREGLPLASINGIQRTTNGYLWLATKRGLVRFDGARFKTFDSQNTPQFRTNGFTALLADPDGGLWAGAPDGLFHVLGGKPEGPNLVEVRPHLSVNALAAGAARAVWVLSATNELVRIAGGKRDGHFKSPSGLPIRAIAADKSGKVVAVVSNALYTITNGQFVKWSGNAAGLTQIDKLAASHTGDFWAAAVREARLLNETGGFFTPRTDPASKESPQSPITSLLEDHMGRLWAGTHGGGIYCFQIQTGWRQVTARRSRSFGSISALYEDGEGSIWAGTSAGILHHIKPRLLTSWSLPATAQEHVPHTICVAQEGAVWVGTDGAGAYRCKDGIFSHFGPKQGLSNATVMAILEDRRTNLWFGTYGGLFRLEDGRLKSELTSLLSGQPVPVLFQDSAGDLWIGAVGLVLRKHGDEVKTYDLGEAVHAYEVRAITEGPRGQIWIGTRGGGLFRLQNGIIQKHSRFRRPAVMALHYDSEGALWVGTLNNGLFRLGDGLTRHWMAAEGLPSNTLYAILEDDAGTLWLSSNEGVFGVSKQALETYRPGLSAPLVTIHLGAPDRESWSMGSGQPAAVKGPDGRLWFPMGHGVVSFSPPALTRTRLAWPVLMEEVLVDGVERPFSAANSLSILSGVRRLEFRFTIADLAAPGRLNFRYKLEGLEDKWVDAGMQRAASYGYLPPGQYRFHVVSSGSQGAWTEMAAPLTVEIVPRLWERRWFQALVALLILAAVAATARAIERVRVRRKVERLELQETMEKERRRIAQDLHDDLGAGLTEIMLLGELAKGNSLAPAEVQAEISTMTDKARRLAAAMDEIVWTVNPKNDLVPNLASYICDYAREFFRASAARCRIDMADALPPVPLTAQTRHNLFLAVKEALNNAAKHSGATEVWLHLRCEDNHFLVIVKDNGRGFEFASDHGDGLDNMRARLVAAGGRADIISRPGEGTAVHFSLPLPTAE